ncbi:MAG TPA: tetratricopeptide repeat protein [Terriglobales bacterium]|nr:tetratricopeptide repeat protein [Terriglobales bacterium]
MRGKHLSIAITFLLSLAISHSAAAQTFEVNQPSKGHARQKSNSAATNTENNGIGWGSGIETAREARAVDQALQKGDYPSAIASATRAAHSAPQNAELWFLLGYAARLGNNYSLSLEGYQRGLQLKPSSIPGLSGEAQTYAKMGRTSDAQDLLKKVLAANPKSPTDLQLSGELALNTDPTTALDLLKRADAIQPDARTELLIARAYQKLNQTDASKQYLDRALNRAPNDPNVLRAVAAYYRDEGKFDESIATLQKAVQQNPDALAELGYTYGLAGKKKEAADAYIRAANRYPKDAPLQLSAAQALVNTGSFEQASDYLKRAEPADPNNYRLHAIRAEMDALEDHNDDAIKEYQAAIRNLPEAPQEGPLYPVSLHLSLSEIYRRVEQGAAATTELANARTALNKIPGTDQATRPDYLRLRALIEDGFNDPAAAERDLKEAMSLAPNNVSIELNYANLLWKLNRDEDALALYKHSLQMDPGNHAALTALGYLSRDLKDPVDAEKYFLNLAELYPQDYVPYFALGDLYTSNHKYDRAQSNYEKAHQLAPKNALVVAEGINSALESPGHSLPIAKVWVARAAADPAINDNPQVMRERERYLTFTGHYQESADLGYKVIEKLPNDPEAPDYLAYDLLFLNRYDDAYKIVQRFEPLKPHDRDMPLIAGYVHAHTGHSREAEADFTRSLAIDPDDATAYMNRGYVRNDLREAGKAVQDFEMALKMRPNYGEAHLGLAYADLQLHRSKPALREADLAAATLPDSAAIHLARAEAYRQQMLFHKAEPEYREALKLAPNDINVHLELAEALYRLNRYNDSLDVLRSGIGVNPAAVGNESANATTMSNDGILYAEMARDYAQLRQKSNAYKAIGDAEKRGDDVKILMATGEALLILGDNHGAMQRYSRALDAPGADRVEVRLALARLFAQSGHHGDSQDQVAFAMAESRIGEANAITPENLIEAGQVLVSINQYNLAKRFFQRAQAEGADQESVYLGLANADLALGQTESAMTLLQAVGRDPDVSQDYDYLMALASAYQQDHRDPEALSTFARANDVMAGNEYAQATEIALAGEQGRQVTPEVNAAPELLLHPIFEDINIYQTDARIRGLSQNSPLLPPPRSSVETLAIAHYRLNFKGWPAITGLFEERNAQGSVSFPNELLIQYRNTYDTIFSTGVNPVFHVLGQTISVNPGLQFTIRRDSASPLEMNQDLFRQYVYVYTSAFGNWVAMDGSLIREAGPFTEMDLHSRDFAGSIEFQVGRPWGKTSLLTGYEGRDILFRPLIREYYMTDSYVGLQRKFGSSWTAAVLADYLRSWRVQDNLYAIAEAFRPGFRVDYRPLASHWAVHAEGLWSKGEGFSAYNNVSNAVTVSYTKGLQRPMEDGTGEIPVTYPLRISLGVQQQSFYDFNGRNRNTWVPIIHLNVF